MPFIDRNAIRLTSSYSGRPKRASLHTDAPPTDANRITQAGYAMEGYRGTSPWFGTVDSSPGIEAGTDPMFLQYAECDFTVGGRNPAAPDGTHIRSIRFEYQALDDTWVELCWGRLDIAYPAPAGPGLLHFREPGSLSAGQEEFLAPHVEIAPPPAATVGAQGGAGTNSTTRRGQGDGTDWWDLWFRQIGALGVFSLSRATRAAGNTILVLTDTPNSAVAAPDWPEVANVGIASKFFIHGGVEETALDLVNVREIVIPSASTDRTIPRYWAIKGAPRGITRAFRNRLLFWGPFGACGIGGMSRTLDADDEIVIGPESLCYSMYGRWSDPAFIPPEPGQATGLRADTRDPERTRLVWDALRGAHGYLVQVARDAAFTDVVFQCAELSRRTGLHRWPQQEWHARVRATNAAGGGLWSDPIAFTPGALGAAPTDLAVVATETSLTWTWSVPEGVERCGVEWTGAREGAIEVTVSPGGQWTYPISGLTGGDRIGLRVRTLLPDVSDWTPADDYVWGTTAAPTAIAPPTNLRTRYIGTTDTQIEWRQQPRQQWSRIRLQWTRATGGAPGALDQTWVTLHPVHNGLRVGGALLGSVVTITVQAGETRDGPWSAGVSLRVQLRDGKIHRPDPPTNMQAAAEVGGVRLSWELPEDVFFAVVEVETTQPGAADAVESEHIVGGEDLLIPGFAGTMVRARAFSASDRRGRVRSETATDWVEATITEVVPEPLGLSLRPVSNGVWIEWTNAEGVAGTTVRWQQARESFAANARRQHTNHRSTVRVPGRSVFVRARPGDWIRARVQHFTEAGALSPWVPWAEVRVPLVAQAPQIWALETNAGGDVSATWVAPPTALAVVEIEVGTEVPTDNVIGERSVFVEDRSARSQVIDTRQVVDKTIRARARYASFVQRAAVRGPFAIGPFSPWTDYASATVILAAPEVSGVTTDDSITFTISAMTGARFFDYRMKGDAAWKETPAVHTIENLNPATTYTLEFRARNAGGVSPTTEMSFTTLAAVAPIPAVPSVTFSSSTSSTVTFAIGTVTGASRYEWTRTPAVASSWVIDNTGSVTISGLSGGTSVTLYARACNASGCSANGSASGSTTSAPPTTPCPSRPSAPTATFTTTSTSISGLISAVSGAADYQYRIGTSGPYTTVGSNRRFTATGLQPSTAYRVEVRARHGDSRSQCQGSRNSPATPYTQTTDASTEVPSPTARARARGPDWIEVAITNPNSNVTAHQARIRTGTRGSWGSWQQIPATGWRRFAGLSPGTLYTIEVRAQIGTNFSTGNNTYGWKTRPARPTATATEGRTSIRATISAVTGADRYRYRHGASATTLGSWTTIASGGRTFTIPNLASNTARVVEVAAGHDQAWSNTRRYTWRTTGTVAAPPFSLTSNTSTSGTFSVSASAIPSGAKAQWRGTNWTDISGRSVTIGSLSPGTSYNIEFRLVLADGSESAIRRVSFWTRPARPSISVTAPSSSSVRVRITAVTGATSYGRRHRKGTGAWSAWSRVGLDSTITGLDAGSTYNVEVRAEGNGGVSTSATGSATTTSTLGPAPTLVSASARQIGAEPWELTFTVRFNQRTARGLDTHVWVDAYVRQGSVTTRYSASNASGNVAVTGVGTTEPSSVRWRARSRLSLTGPQSIIGPWSEWSSFRTDTL